MRWKLAIRLWLCLLVPVLITMLLISFINNLMAAVMVLAAVAVVAAIALSKYLSDRIQELETLNEMTLSFQKQEQQYHQHLSEIAHELRTPVANVTAQLEAVLEGVWEPTLERLQNCYEELWRITDLIRDLEEMELRKLHLERVDLLELTQQSVASFAPELRRKQLNCTVTGESVLISGDSNRLRQVITNLLSNAIKYTPKGRCIDIQVFCRENHLFWSIADQGIGISKADIPYIFERFYRSARVRNSRAGGRGIGLAVAKAIIRAHDGQITVEARERSGAKFTFSLPIQ